MNKSAADESAEMLRGVQARGVVEAGGSEETSGSYKDDSAIESLSERSPTIASLNAVL